MNRVAAVESAGVALVRGTVSAGEHSGSRKKRKSENSSGRGTGEHLVVELQVKFTSYSMSGS